MKISLSHMLIAFVALVMIFDLYGSATVLNFRPEHQHMVTEHDVTLKLREVMKNKGQTLLGNIVAVIRLVDGCMNLRDRRTSMLAPAQYRRQLLQAHIRGGQEEAQAVWTDLGTDSNLLEIKLNNLQTHKENVARYGGGNGVGICDMELWTNWHAEFRNHYTEASRCMQQLIAAINALPTEGEMAENVELQRNKDNLEQAARKLKDLLGKEMHTVVDDRERRLKQERVEAARMFDY